MEKLPEIIQCSILDKSFQRYFSAPIKAHQVPQAPQLEALKSLHLFCHSTEKI